MTTLLETARSRILILDGAMGTQIQTFGLTEADYRGERFKDWPRDVKGNNDLLTLTQPAIIRGIHDAFLEAGADIIETNSFNCTTISQADYGMEELAYELNVEAAKLARVAADAMTAKTPDKPRYVAGSIGPTNRTLSISPDVNRPGHREVTFDQMVTAYTEQVNGLMDGGVDMILIETIFDTLNAKAAIFAVEGVFEARGVTLPLMISGTVTDMSGRNLSGQTVEAFWYSLRHAKPFSFGLNCAFGADQLRPHVAALSKIVDTNLCIYPNAGLPNEMGAYDETPCMTAGFIKDWADQGLLNIVGGCCGTTPEHIRHMAEAVAGKAPRAIPAASTAMQLSGLDPMTIG